MNKELLKDFPVKDLIPYERNPRINKNVIGRPKGSKNSIIKITLLSEKCKCGCNKIAREGRKYISGHNSIGRRKEYIKIECLWCKKTLELPPGKYKRKFCSLNCRDEYRRTLVGDKSPYSKKIEVICAYCGKVFKTIPCRITNGKIPYCSPVCGHTAQALKLAKLGKSTSKEGCWSFGKRAVYDRDNRKCVICGFDIVIHAHHIKPRSKGGSNHLDNMITLCPNHHAMVHHGIITEIELIRYIKNDRKYN